VTGDERARLAAAQAKADEIAATVGEVPDGPLLRVAITDVETNTRLRTCFATYQPDEGAPPLRLVGEGS
jgi:hypothetical protein